MPPTDLLRRVSKLEQHITPAARPWQLVIKAPHETSEDALRRCNADPDVPVIIINPVPSPEEHNSDAT